MNPLAAIPTKVRGWLYLVYIAAGPTLTWTQDKGWTDPSDYQFWLNLGTALFGATALSNLGRPRQRVTAGVKPTLTIPPKEQ